MGNRSPKPAEKRKKKVGAKAPATPEVRPTRPPIDVEIIKRGRS